MPLSRAIVIYDATTTANTTGDWVPVPPEMLEGALVLEATELGGTTPAFTVTVTHGWNDTLDTEDVTAFTATSGTSDQRKSVAQDDWAIASTASDISTLRPFIRASITTSGTTPTGRLVVSLWKRSPA